MYVCTCICMYVVKELLNVPKRQGHTWTCSSHAAPAGFLGLWFIPWGETWTNMFRESSRQKLGRVWVGYVSRARWELKEAMLCCFDACTCVLHTCKMNTGSGEGACFLFGEAGAWIKWHIEVDESLSCSKKWEMRNEKWEMRITCMYHSIWGRTMASRCTTGT